MPTKPKALPISTLDVPASLRALNRWVLWKYEWTEARQDFAKVPFAVAGYRASSVKASSWSSYQNVVSEFFGKPEAFDGIGFVLGDGFVGIDIDDCVLEDGSFSAFAQRILAQVEGYAELSPSGTGIKIITRAALTSAAVDHTLGLEIYPAGRYFTVTGHAINGHNELPDYLVDVGAVIAEHMGKSLPVVHDHFDDLKLPLADWSADRIGKEILPCCDPDTGYSDWLRVGQALHHQTDGSIEGLELWDSWSQGSSKYLEGECEYKWTSFNGSRGNVITLASLLKETQLSRSTVKDTEIVEKVTTGLALVKTGAELLAYLRGPVHALGLTKAQSALILGAIMGRVGEFGITLTRGQAQKMITNYEKTGLRHFSEDGHPLETVENLIAICDAENIVIRYNVIKKTVEILHPGLITTLDNASEVSLARLKSLCHEKGMGTRSLLNFVTAIADMNPYNAVTTWVESTPWDGVSRLQDFYDTLVTGPDFCKDLKATIMRKWAVSAIKAVFDPEGITARGVLVVQGNQYIGKTRWINSLAPRDLEVIQTGKDLHLNDKDSKIQAIESWITELGELDATFRKSEMAALKAFITQDVDKIRRPYAVGTSTYRRRTVFYASVNDEQFLFDKTGNSRFWVIPVLKAVHDHDIDTQQFWAEVLDLYRSGEKHYLEVDEMLRLEHSNEDATVMSGPEELILEVYDWDDPKPETWRRLSTMGVMQELGLPVNSQRDKNLVAGILKKISPYSSKIKGLTKYTVPPKREFD